MSGLGAISSVGRVSQEGKSKMVCLLKVAKIVEEARVLRDEKDIFFRSGALEELGAPWGHSIALQSKGSLCP